MLQGDLNPCTTEVCLQKSQDNWIQDITTSLRIPAPPVRPRSDDVQITWLFREILRLSGDCVSDGPGENRSYTMSQHADLCATILKITTISRERCINHAKVYELVSRSPVYSAPPMSPNELHNLTQSILENLHLGRGDRDLVGSSRNGFA